MTLTNPQKTFISTIKEKIRHAQYEAYKDVNTHLIRLYWEIGKDVSENQVEFMQPLVAEIKMIGNMARKRCILKYGDIKHYLKIELTLTIMAVLIIIIYKMRVVYDG